MSLLNQCVAFWLMEEASGDVDRIDATGRGNDFQYELLGGGVPGSYPTQETGVVGYSVGINASDGVTMYVADNDDLDMSSDQAFTLAGWFRVTGYVGSRAPLLDKFIEYGLDFLQSAGPGLTGSFRFWVNDAAGNEVIATAPAMRVDGDWHFVKGWHDPDEDTINVQVDCGTIASTAHSAGVRNVAQTLVIGGRVGYGLTSYRADAVGIWRRVLDTYDTSLLCPGLEFPFGLCGTILYGDYEFAETFHPADDSFEWMPAISKLPRAHGARALDFYAQPRQLLVRGGEIKGPFNQTDLRTRVDAIRNALGAQPQMLQFEPDRYWRDVRVEYFRNPYGPTHYCRIAAEMEIGFVARDPFQYALTPSTETWSSPTTGTHTVTGGGAADLFAKPIIYVTVGGAGTVSLDMTLANTTAGESFSLIGDVTGGNVIVVDCLDYTVQIGSTDEMALFDGIFPRLNYAANTWTLTLNTGTLTSIRWSWRNRWW